MVVKKESKEKPSVVASPNEGGAAAAPGVEVPAAAPAGEINVDDFSRLVANMSRLLAGFSQLKALREAGLGLGDWVTLGMLARQDGMTKKVIARGLGISVKRVAQITSSLTEKGLISAGQPAQAGKAEDGKAGKMLKVTDAGKVKLEGVNKELKTTLGAVLKARSVGGALKQIRPFGRVLRAATTEGANKKKGKKAKQAKGAAEASAASAQV